MILVVLLATYTVGSAQMPGLVFKNPTLQSGSANSVNAVYRFKDVTTDVDAKVKIDSLVNGAQLNKIDDNSGGLGYLDALQPEIRIPSGTSTAYAVFTITFVKANTDSVVIINQIEGTALDIDGNLNLKEFVELGMGGGIATYQTGTIDILVSQLLFNQFKGLNILGIERSGIDTSALGNMFTVAKNNVSSFSVKFGAETIAANNVNRQFSLYMKGFNYINSSTLPIKLKSFNAFLKNDNKVDLKWITSSEINVSHFVIEKSTDGSNYSDAGIVFAYGNSTTDVNYAFTDNLGSSAEGVFYYRLRSVDNDEKTQFSETRIIKISNQKMNTVTIMTYPNPVSSSLRITIPSSWQNKKVVYEMFQANGQVVKRTETASSSQTETLNVSNLAPGYYIIRAICGGEVAQQNIIKH